MKEGLSRQRVLEFADKFAMLLTEADDLGVHWTVDDGCTHVAVYYPDEADGNWQQPPVVIGWNGRNETWGVTPPSRKSAQDEA